MKSSFSCYMTMLKKNLFFLAILCACLVSHAQGFVPDGYYRMQNYGTGRYVRVVDNRGSVDIRRTQADLAALVTRLKFENVVNDPASVMYIKYLNSTDTLYMPNTTPKKIKEISQLYNIYAQGTDVVTIIGFGVRVKKSTNGYHAFQEQSGMRAYINDTPLYDEIDGYVMQNDASLREWSVCAIDPSDNNSYFGIVPNVSVGGKHYYPFYMGFPFSFHSNGMKAYYVKRIDKDNGICVIAEISGIVPALTPVIIECSGLESSGNRLALEKPGSGTAVSGNMLFGAMFKNDYKQATGHRNRVDYDSSTMRILGVTDKGKLGFITAPAGYDAIDANSAYLKATYLPAQLELMTESEYEQFMSVDAPKSDVLITAWTLDGTPRQVKSLDELPRGLYIVDGHKYIVRSE
ncbi:MAG: hypothetical protein MJY58_01685 [Bacteroidaceae bacterium]|nr:hypothetical protein [Bacteroidaceae bacterium]